MAYNTGIYGNGYNDYFYTQLLNGNKFNPLSGSTVPTISFQQNQQQQQAVETDKYAADDGKISFGSKLKNFGKGVVKFFTGMFTDENGKFSLKKTLKTALTAVAIGAVCVLTAGTAVPALIAAGGIVASGVGVAKGAVRASKATTDAEAEAAWQSIGSSTTALGLSIVGAKAVAKSYGVQVDSGLKGYGQSVKFVFEKSGTAIKDSAVGIHNAWQGAAGEGLSGRLSAVKDNIVHEQGKAFADTVKGNYHESVTNIKNKIETKENANLEQKQSSYQERANNAKSETAKDYWQKKADGVQRKIDARNEMNRTSSYQEGAELIEQQRAKIQNTNNEIAEAMKAGDTDKVASLRQQLQAETDVLKTQRNILNRRTAETNAIESQISSKQQQIASLEKTNPGSPKIAELQSEVDALQSKVTFETTRTQLRADGKSVQDFSKQYIEAQKMLQRARATGDPALIAEAKDYVASLNVAKQGMKGNQYTQAISEILIDAKNSPVANWLTLETIGQKQHYPTASANQATQANIALLQQYGYLG